MKRLSKKQKLIVAIAIILIVVILAIVITTNIISNNSQIANEGYFATTANASSKLIASYIKEGVKVGGITGTLKVLDTSDADATPEDISWGKTAYVNGVKITGIRSTLDTVTGNETKNSYVNDKYGNQVVVPAGFKVVNPYDDVTKGIIIQDVSAPGNTSYTKGSQFVWIPVGDVITDSNGSKTTIILGRYTFDSDGTEHLVQSADNWSDTSSLVAIDTYYKELATSSYGNATAKNLENFVEETLSSGGYYIGRYEAGDATATSIARNGTVNVSNPSNPIACKSGVYPYSYVNQKDASSLCKGMYSSSNFDSDLINSYAWDTAVVFIQTFSGDTDYSRQNRLQTTIAKCGEATDGTNKDVKSNIYDMAGNTWEWTTETKCDTSFPCTARGGVEADESFYTSAHNHGLTTSSFYNGSFRPILYL